MKELIVDIPKRSYLYSLPPIGVGTEDVESLTSYVRRLSGAHNLTLGIFFSKIIYPEINKADIPRDGVTAKKSSAFNSFHNSAKELTLGLKQLTLIENLEQLTLLNFDKFLSSNELRGQKLWCPRCYEDTTNSEKIVYDKLIWSFKSIDICQKHMCKLVSKCPNCNRIQYHLHRDGKLGYCYKCNQWLGVSSFSECEILEDEYIHWQGWVVKNIGELLIINNKKRSILNGSSKNSSEIIDEFKESIKNNFGVTIKYINDISKRDRQFNKQKASIYSLLKLGYVTNNSLLEILSGNYKLNFPLKRLPNIIYDTDYGIKKVNKIDELRNQLSNIIKNKNNPPPSLNTVSRMLGYKKPENLRRRLPIETNIIVENYKIFIQDQKDSKRNEIKQAIIKLSKEGIYPSQKLIEEELNQPSMFWKNTYRDILNDICRELNIKRKDGPKTRRL